MLLALRVTKVVHLIRKERLTMNFDDLVEEFPPELEDLKTLIRETAPNDDVAVRNLLFNALLSNLDRWRKLQYGNKPVTGPMYKRQREKWLQDERVQKRIREIIEGELM